jgi:hypothetical protein
MECVAVLGDSLRFIFLARSLDHVTTEYQKPFHSIQRGSRADSSFQTVFFARFP